MAVPKRKLDSFIAIKEAVKEVASDNDLNEDLADSLYLKRIGMKFLLAFAKHDICTVRDLVFSETETILTIVKDSEKAISRIASALRRLYFSLSRAQKHYNSSVPDVSLAKTFAVLHKMSNEQLAVYINLGNMENPRLANALEKAEIYTYQDLKDAGIEKVQRINGLGKKTYEELYEIVEAFYSNENSEIDDIINQFRNFLLEANKEVKDDFDVKPLEEKLYGYISEFVDSLGLGRNGEVFKLRIAPEKTTLTKISEKYGLTRERVRQIVARVNLKVVNSFVNRNKASTIEPIKNFYSELMSVDKDIVLYPLYELIQKRNTITDILYHHFKAIGLLASQIVIIRPESEETKTRKKYKTDADPDLYLTNGILSAVAANDGKWRINKLADLLHGTFDFVFEKAYFANKEFFGWGKKYTRTFVVDSICCLINEGLLREMKDGKLFITNKGKSFMELMSRHIIRNK